jgi:hypothetical protein
VRAPPRRDAAWAQRRRTPVERTWRPSPARLVWGSCHHGHSSALLIVSTHDRHRFSGRPWDPRRVTVGTPFTAPRRSLDEAPYPRATRLAVLWTMPLLALPSTAWTVLIALMVGYGKVMGPAEYAEREAVYLSGAVLWAVVALVSGPFLRCRAAALVELSVAGVMVLAAVTVDHPAALTLASATMCSVPWILPTSWPIGLMAVISIVRAVVHRRPSARRTTTSMRASRHPQ